MSNEIESWLPIPGYEGFYEFSNLYRVRSMARKVPHRGNGSTRSLKERFLSVYPNNGYLIALLSRAGKVQKFYVEAAVETTFGIRQKTDDIPVLPGEEWSPVAGYEDLYEISSHGRVKSIGWYVSGAKRRYARARIRVNGSDAGGYPKVELAKNGAIKTVLIHRLVAIAFVPNPLNLGVVHHKDENRLNPRADNLEWVSTETNIRDWFDRRRLVVGIDTIETIIAAHAAGKSPAEILAGLPRRTKKRNSA